MLYFILSSVPTDLTPGIVNDISVRELVTYAVLTLSGVIIRHCELKRFRGRDK